MKTSRPSALFAASKLAALCEALPSPSWNCAARLLSGHDKCISQCQFVQSGGILLHEAGHVCQEGARPIASSISQTPSGAAVSDNLFAEVALYCPTQRRGPRGVSSVMFLVYPGEDPPFRTYP